MSARLTEAILCERLMAAGAPVWVATNVARADVAAGGLAALLRVIARDLYDREIDEEEGRTGSECAALEPCDAAGLVEAAVTLALSIEQTLERLAQAYVDLNDDRGPATQ